ncbi:MAG: chromate resistance protein [Rhodopseudomonas sp.]|uniref:sulfurtransferase/chromate resistance protein n=1 Tax=Rhodopseudomonas sp. TaxID=1078 RepID=UPI001836B348|nr:sulfurtransferase/chromate resistance protein [Rhodopseudomonas sp.]NVN85607.1 chromate resistance protein [Rhodopseudomonas sp.]
MSSFKTFSSFNSISVENLAGLIGMPDCPALIDVRTDDDFALAPCLLPGSRRQCHDDVAAWSSDYRGVAAIVICQRGLKLSQGVAAWLRADGVAASVLEGGYSACEQAALPRVPVAKLPARDLQGRTIWVTRERPKIDRIACPWLIRRFVDPDAVFLFVAPGEVPAVAEKFGATPFDIEGVFWSHRGDTCSFDTLIEEWGLGGQPLLRLATIVRGADTGRLDLAPEATGLLAVSLGLSRMHDDDLAQLEAGMLLYDALYRWCRDDAGETHNWPVSKREGVA